MSQGAGRYYDRIADLWDAIYGTSVPYDEGFRYIDGLRKELGLEPVVLDVGCGTGELLLRFEHAGYETYGADRSMKMVRRAQAKCRRSEVKRATFRDVSVGRKVAIVTSFFNSLAYCQIATELTRTLKHLRGQIVPGGIVDFDVCSVEEPGKSVDIFNVKAFELADACVSRTFHGVARRRRFSSEMTYVVHWRNGTKRVISEKTRRGRFSTEDVTRCLKRAGLHTDGPLEGYMGRSAATFVGRRPVPPRQLPR